MDHNTLSELSYKSLITCTNNFSESNYLGQFQFGKLYRGKIVRFGEVQHVVVKIWEVPVKYRYSPGDNELRLMDELILLRHPMLIHHPGMVTLCGFCFDGEHLGVVYELKAFDSVFNLIPKDGFTWLQRIKVALGFANLLKFLHTGKSQYKPFIVRNLDAAHVLVDEDFNPKLCDFGMITGGIFPDRTKYKDLNVLGCYGYIDLHVAYTGNWSDEQDVFAFGVVLLGLITKRVYTEEDRHNSDAPLIHDWAWEEYTTNLEKYSLVHPSLAADPNFAPADAGNITFVALRCVNDRAYQRPTMKQVLKRLLKLKVVKQHPDFLGVNKMHSPF